MKILELQPELVEQVHDLSCLKSPPEGCSLVRESSRSRLHRSRAFPALIYTLSENPMIAPAMEAHWTYTQRVMGEVLMRDEKPRDIWDQHEGLMKAIASGKADKAEELARQHIQKAADFMVARLRASLPKDGAAARDQ